jgi:hypothetical protein
MKYVLRLLMAVTVLAVTFPAPSAAQNAPAPQNANAVVLPYADPAVTRRAIEWLERVQTGDIDRAQLDATIDRKFTPQTVALLQSRLSPLGKPFGAAFGGSRVEGQTVVYRYVVAFQVGSIEEYISFDHQGKLAGLVFSK